MQMKEKRENKNVLLCGFYGCGNLGDDALLLSLLEYFARYAPHCRVFFLTGGDKALSRSAAAFHAVGVPRMRPSALSAIRACDALILGGGSVLQNSTGQASLGYYLALLGFAQGIGKKTAILSGGLGPIDGNAARKAVSAVLRRLSFASFRDADAAELARSLGAREPRLSADPALLLSEVPCELPLPKRYLLVSLRKKTGLSPKEAAALVFRCAERRALVPVFCDLFPREDGAYTVSVAREVSLLYAAAGKRRAAWTLPHLSPGRLCAVASKAAFVLSGRYHLALFAYSASVPFRVIGRDPKLSALSREKRSPEAARRLVFEDFERLKSAIL